MTLDDFKTACITVAARLGLTADDIYSELCLTLADVYPECIQRYPSTPVNSTYLASMQCDGCHWVILHMDDGRPLHECPVVHVMPMEEECCCAGENFREFIEMECQAAENCARDDLAEAGDELGDDDPEEFGDPRRRLRIVAALREALGLRPRPDWEDRFDELEPRYRELMKFEHGRPYGTLPPL